MKNYKLIFFLLSVFAGFKGIAQQPTVLGTEVVNGAYTTYNLNAVGGFRQIRVQATSAAANGVRKWEFATGTAAAPNYSNNWRPFTAGLTLANYNVFINPVGGTASAFYNTGFGGQGGLLPAITANNYYTFNISNNSAANNNMAVHETTYNPETISAVTRSPVTVGATAGATINITTSVAPQANIFVRYSTVINFATSTIVQASFVGVNGTAVIPAQTPGTNIYYYVYSSTATKSTIDADVTTYGQGAHDIYTLNINNNSGSNYTYLVLPVTVNGTANPANDASYATLTAAFAGINAGTHQGAITVSIAGNTTETAIAVLNASGAPAAYTSVIVQPFGGVPITVTGNFAGNPLINLNGADNVTIDGLNSGGNTLTLVNTNAAGAGTSTIRFLNNTINNAIQNCIIQGASTSTSAGTIFFSTGTNANITITGNTITQAATTPNYAIYASGSSNTAIAVTNNNIQDYYNAAAASSGINATTGSSAWVITGNKFFQTAARTATNGSFHRAIQISNGGGYTINDNIIGYANSSSTGITTYMGAFGNRFMGIELNVSATLSSVQNNTIAGITLSSSSGATTSGGIFSGIYVSAGTVNIGTTTKNIIGIPSTGPISITVANSSGSVNGINVASIGTCIIQNNTIAAFSTTSNPVGSAHTFNGITVSGTGSFTVSGNTIGGSINVGISATAACNVYGISTAATGTVTIGSTGSPNIISGLTSSSTSGSLAYVAGVLINSSGGNTSVNGNTISSLTSAGLNVIGIRNASTSSNIPAVTIGNNNINTLSSTNNFATLVGVEVAASNGGTNILKNKIYGLNATGSSPFVYGIALNFSLVSNLTISNNIIGNLTIPNNTAALPGLPAPPILAGISINTNAVITANVYYNTVYLTGTASGADFGSAAFYCRTNPIADLRNNAFVNLCTAKGTGRTVAHLRSSASIANYVATSNNNLFYSGAPSATNLIYFDGTNAYQTIATYIAMTAPATLAPRDAAAVSALPPFLSTTGANADFLHIDATIANVLESGGANIASFIDDFDGDIRQGNAGYSGLGTAPDIGADEFEACSDANFRWVGGTSADWNVPANWCTVTTIPSATSNVVIPSGTLFSPDIFNANAVAKSVTINTGATLSLSNTRTLTISTTGSFSNNSGTFTATGTGAVIFAGTGTISGLSATSFKNVTINGVLSIPTVPTFTGNFQINAGGSIAAAPNYGSISTLIYNTGTTTAAGAEWLSGIASGTGIPQNVTIGNGANTIVNFGSDASYRQALGNVLISAGTNNLTLSTASGGNLQVGGNWTNDVGVGGFTGNSRLVTFNGSTNAIIAGTGSTTFAQLAVNKGAGIATTLDVNVAIIISPTAAITQVTSGLLRINATGSVIKSAISGWNIGSNGGIHTNGGIFTQNGASVSNAGWFQISSGTATIGNLAGAHSLVYSNGSVIIVSGGTLNIDSRISPLTAGVSAVTYNQSGGTVNVLRVSSGSSTFAAFDIGAAASSFTWSNGSIIIPGACSFTSDYFVNAATNTVTGGTLQIGNASTPASQTIRIRSNAPVFNLTIDNSSANNPVAQLVTSNLTVNGTSTLNNGTTLDINGRTLTQAGPVANAGGTYSGSNSSNLTINGAGAVTGNYNFAIGGQNLGILNVNRSGVPVTIGTNLTLNVDGSNIALNSTVNNLTATSLIIGSGAFTGLTIYGTLNVAGTLQFNAGGYINGGGAGMRGPLYAANSLLIYNTGFNFTRNVEWGSNTPATEGYPHHVVIQNGTTLNFTATTTFDVGCAGNLTIGNPSLAGLGTLVLTNYALPSDLYVGGNLTIGGTTASGTLTMSDAIGSDVRLTGNWLRNSTGSVNFGSGNGRAVFFEGSTDATITASNGQTFPYVYINKTAKTNKVTLADHVNITDEIGFAKGTVDLGTNKKFLTIVSTATKTARVGPSDSTNTAFVYGTSDTTGQFIVQRYLQARRSWRLMTAPLVPGGGAHTISEAWQERGLPTYTGLDYRTPASTATSLGLDTAAIVSGGFATQITGGIAANGFDQSPNNNTSIRYYNAGSWVGPANINATGINSREGWMLFVRGDRRNFGQITNQYKTPTITTLRPRGQIFIGRKSITSTGMTVVGNPYASAIDYTTMTRTGSGWPAFPTYYVWDPSLGGATGQGAFITFTWNGSVFLRTSPYGAGGYDSRYIPSGAAVMVDFPSGSGTLNFAETDKNVANTTNAFRPTSVPNQLMTVLNTVNPDHTTYVSDGVLSLFNNNFSNAVDVDDAIKLGNFTEDFGLAREGKMLSIERRKTITEVDTIFYNIAKMQHKNYQLQFIMDNVEAPASTVAFLEDIYLKKKTPLRMQDTTKVDFSISTTEAAAPDRFRLVFRRSVVYTNVNAFVLKSDIAVDWKVADEFNLNNYVIERSADGNSFTATGTVQAGNNSEVPVNYRWIDAAPQPGEYFYRIMSISNNGTIAYSEVVKVTIVRSSPNLYVFPNPVTGNTIQLQMNDQPAGQYSIRIINNLGQVLINKMISHGGGTATHKIQPESVLLSGVYQLEVIGADKKARLINIVVNR